MKRILAISLLIPSVASAEVMDKEPSLLSVWIVGIVAAALIFGAARLRPWLMLVLAPIFVLLSYAQLSEVLDPVVGPAIKTEAGSVYIASSWAAPTVVVLAGLLGVCARKRGGTR